MLAEWKDTDEGPALHVYCHVSGGFVFGSAQFRYEIFQDELPLVLEALRYGDSSFFAAHPQLDTAPICVHFESCTVSCPVCGAEMICTHEDPKHEGKHRCEKGHEWT